MWARRKLTQQLCDEIELKDSLRHTSSAVGCLVSVIMPAHNSAETIADSIASVIAQTYSRWELLVVNDASTDATLAMVNELAAHEPRIKVISLESNGGVANARNAGLADAQGRYVAFLDSDDQWLPHKLEAQIQFMQQEQVAFSFTSYRKFGRDGSVRGEIKARPSITYHDLLKDNVIGCLTVMIDRRIVPVVSMPQVRHEDFACWLQILKTGVNAHGLDEDLARYRVAPDSVSGQKKRSLVWRWQIYRELEKLSLGESAWYFAHYSANAVVKRLRA